MADGESAAGRSSRSRRVLILTEQPDLAELFTLQLGAAGWCVEQVGSEGEAVAVVSAEPPDAVILDTLVPAASGQPLVDRLRAELAGRPCRLVISTIYEPSDFVGVDVDAVLPLPHHRAALEEALLRS